MQKRKDRPLYTGIIPALITPFTKTGEVNPEILREMTNWLIDQQMAGLYICGSTGEGLLLSEVERKLVAETVVTEVSGRVPVIVHVGSPSAVSAEELSRHAGEIGASAVASVPPLFFSFNKAEIENYYTRIKQASDLPVYFYHIPVLTHNGLDIDLARSMFNNGVIQGMKYTHHDMLTFRGIVEACEGKLNIFSGPDEMLLPFLGMGAHGGIGATYSAMPKLYYELFNAWQKGDVEKAQEMQFIANRVILTMAPYGIIPAVKAVMQMLGLDCGEPRLPFLPLSQQKKAQLKDDLLQVGFFNLEKELA